MIVELLLQLALVLGPPCALYWARERLRYSPPTYELTNAERLKYDAILEAEQVVEPLAEVQHKEVRLKQVSVNTTQDERNEWRRESHKVSHKSKLGVGINLEDVPMSWNWDDEKPF